MVSPSVKVIEYTMYSIFGDDEDGVVVMTKIDDCSGCRNEQKLKRQGHLRFPLDGS